MATPSSTSSPSFQLGDVYYVLFRHKWKIMTCILVGVVAAAVIYKRQPPPYTSEAKLFIRFVISEGRSAEPGENDTITMSPDGRGATVINSEVQIITSRDISEIVARNIGPEKILAGISDSRSVAEAASVVRSGLTVELPSKSSTVRLLYQHPNAEMAQLILNDIVKTYLKRHQEIHRSPGMVGDFLAQETDQLRARLVGTEEELRKVNQKAGVVSLEDSKRAFSEQLNRIRGDILNSQIELASRTSVYEQMTKQLPAGATQDTPAAVPPRQVEAYQKVLTQLNQLQKREQDLLNYFKEGATRVQEVRAQIAEAETQKQQLLTEFPGLIQIAPAVIQAQGNRPTGFDPQAEAAQITSLQAKIKMLIQQMEQIRTEISALEQLESTILDLRRRKGLEEANYLRYSSSLEQSRIKEAMGDGKVSNISIVQAPTPAFRDWMPIRKIAGGIAIGGVALGIAWAFLIEMFLDHSVRRPAEVERLLHAPLFISIPRLKFNGRPGNKIEPTALTATLPEGAPAPQAESSAGLGQVAVQRAKSSDHLALEPFHQTLRDRLISYFESINLRHKPKLIAVTGLGRSSGVTTTAAGLARSFSETGEGNVLLVDMTQGQGSAQHFQRGTQVGLDQLLDTRNSAFVRDNLYVVSEHSGGDRLAKGMPQRFNQLVPKLKASDFDYIIFDMPPVNQISITPRLAGFMDMTLLVVESEKTDRHVAERAAELLSQSKTNVGVVLNKNKSYVPSKLQQDHEFMLGM
jgi:succinoglycan biosynthesis transport protein ExoP